MPEAVHSFSWQSKRALGGVFQYRLPDIHKSSVSLNGIRVTSFVCLAGVLPGRVDDTLPRRLQNRKGTQEGNK